MIEDERLGGEILGEAEGRLELLRVDEDVVGQAVGGELRDAALEILPEHEVIVGLFLDDVADPDEFRVRGETGEVGLDAVGAQVDPADDAFYVGVLIGEAEEPVGFPDHLTGLDGDRALEAERSLQRGEIVGQPAAVQRGARRDPRVLRRVVRPEVLVGVEAHGVRPRRRSP